MRAAWTRAINAAPRRSRNVVNSRYAAASSVWTRLPPRMSTRANEVEQNRKVMAAKAPTARRIEGHMTRGVDW